MEDVETVRAQDDGEVPSESTHADTTTVGARNRGGIGFSAWWHHQSDQAKAGYVGALATAVLAPVITVILTVAVPSTSPPKPAITAGAASTTGTAASTTGTPAANNASTAKGAQRVPLYTLPANSAGAPGSQQAPYDVALAGAHYPDSTGVSVKCPSSVSQPLVVFYTAGKYGHLAAVAGIADFAPADLTIQMQVWTLMDNGQFGLWKWFTVASDQTYAIDYEIGPYRAIGVSTSTTKGCAASTKPYAYLGSAVVY